MEKSSRGKTFTVPDNFSERVCEKRTTPLPELRADIMNACVCSDFLALVELTRLGEPMCHPYQVTSLGGSPFSPIQRFVSHVNGSPRFVRNLRKGWPVQRSSSK